MNYKQKLQLYLGLIIIVSLLLVVFCILPALRGIFKTSKELALKRQELASVEMMAQNFENFEKNFYLYEEGLEEMENLLSQESLIDPEIPVSFINFFQEQAAGLNLSLKITPVAFHEKEDDFWNYMTFRIDGSGRFIDMMRFLEKLENSRWLVAESDFSIVKQPKFEGQTLEQDNRGDFVKINLLIEVYAQN